MEKEEMRESRPKNPSDSRDNFNHKEICIAIADSGINQHHPHVRRIDGGIKISLSQGKVIYENDSKDIMGHGTAIAGIIRKKAKDALIYSIKVFENALSTHPIILSKAIEWAANNNMRILNLSMGIKNDSYKSMIKEICDYAYEKNVIIVAAGNNEGGGEFYPAYFPNVIGVEADPRCSENIYFYTGETGIEFRSHRWPLKLAKIPQEKNFRGNSMAAAHITGFVALILEKCPEAKFSCIKKMLIKNAPYTL